MLLTALLTGARPVTRPAAVVALALCLGAPGRAAAQASPPPHLVSEVKDLRFVALVELPRASGPASTDLGCSSLVAQPASEAAHAVAGRGWLVMAEASLGRYRVVSFASKMEAGTSGTCSVHDGNVGIFDGSRLVALAYGGHRDDAIGRIAARPDGSVQLSDGDINSSPIGDLRVQADGTLLLGRLPAEEAVCGGRGTVPDIRRMPIDKARAALLAKGWTPVRGGPRADPRERDLVRRGVIEVGNCSGTGLAYCEFAYTGLAGRLSLTTVGDADSPPVSDYAVQCR